MTPAEQTQLDQIERDRRRRELLLLLLLLAVADHARLSATATAIRGGNAAAAARAVILDASSIPRVASLMAQAHQAGFARAAQYTGSTASGQSYESVYAIYRSGTVTMTAQTVLTAMADDMAKLLDRTVIEIKEGPYTPRQLAQRITDTLTRYGWTKWDPKTIDPTSKAAPGYALAGHATDAILPAYNGGYFRGLGLGTATALRHYSVMDQGTTEICQERDGLTLPPGDPYWSTNWPMLHRRCRSCVLPTFAPNPEMSESYPTIPPASGYGLAPTF